MRKFLLAFALAAVCAVPALSSDPSIWSVNSRSDVLKGDARSVSVDDAGVIRIAPKITELYKTEQSYVWSSSFDTAGNIYLGTGSDGRIYKVAPGGSGALFADLAELNVTAIVAGRSGEIFAATSPDGKVYKIDATGKPAVFFEPGEKYIWSLALMNDGSLAVGTGESGKIYRVRSANAAPSASLLYDTSETHIISLAADAQGNLYAGTDSNGLVLRFGSDGKPFALLDSPLREIHQLAVAPNGAVYALAVSESAGAPTPASTPSPSASPENKTVSAAKPGPAAPEQPQKSRYDLTGARSAVYRIGTDGGTSVIWSSTTVTGFSIYAHKTNDGVLIGTSDKGRIYSVTNDARETLVLQSDASQISTIFSFGQDLYATTSNQGRLFKFGSDRASEGIYESAVLDAKSTSGWGRAWWRSTGGVDIQTRSGNTQEPDETWSQWVNVAGSGGGQVASPKAGFLQWRARMTPGTVPATLTELNVAYQPFNIAPEVLSITVHPTNVGLLSNPPPQIDPNIELSGLDPAAFGVVVASVPPRRVYQRAARALQWTAEDRNGDKLTYDLYYKEAADADWKVLKRDITDTFYTIDGLTLADGRYTVRIVARDTSSNPAGKDLSGDRLSEPFDIDNGQPTVTAGAPTVAGDRARVVFSASDRSGYLSRAEYSINGGEWLPVYADDGISDGPEERYTVEIPVRTAGEYSITIRVYDASGNAGNARAVVRK